VVTKDKFPQMIVQCNSMSAAVSSTWESKGVVSTTLEEFDQDQDNDEREPVSKRMRVEFVVKTS